MNEIRLKELELRKIKKEGKNIENLQNIIIDLKNKQKEITDIYYERQYELDEMFKLDLFKYFEVSNNPKREKCFFLAYEYGHSSGNLEIFNYFSELVELIK